MFGADEAATLSFSIIGMTDRREGVDARSAAGRSDGDKGDTGRTKVSRSYVCMETSACYYCLLRSNTLERVVQGVQVTRCVW